jgi:hypothetical protein
MNTHDIYDQLRSYAYKNRWTLAAVALTWAVTWGSCSYSPQVERSVPKAPYPKELIVKKVDGREYPVGAVTMSDRNRFIFLGQPDGSFRGLDDINNEEDQKTQLQRHTEKIGLESELGIK